MRDYRPNTPKEKFASVLLTVWVAWMMFWALLAVAGILSSGMEGK